LPTDCHSIQRRVDEIVFHSSLVAEMQSIQTMRGLAAASSDRRNVLDLRIHRIGPPRAELFDAGSALERSHAWIERLHVEGRRSARRFLGKHGQDIGVRETLDIDNVFVDRRSETVGSMTADVVPSSLAAV